MSDARELMTIAADRVAAALGRVGDIDPEAPTPCSEFTVSDLAAHALGTMTMLAATGRRTAPASPPEVTDHWRRDLAAAVQETAGVWAGETAWQGNVTMGESTVPAAMIGDMVFAEILLHGWDLTRAAGIDLEVDDATAAELRRGVEETAELGRRMGAYGDEVAVASDACDLDRALGAAGRDPNWHA